MRRLARRGLPVALASGAVVVFWRGERLAPRPEPTRVGGRPRIVRCPIHGIAYDSELETCPERAKSAGAPGGRAEDLRPVPPLMEVRTRPLRTMTTRALAVHAGKTVWGEPIPEVRAARVRQGARRR